MIPNDTYQTVSSLSISIQRTMSETFSSVRVQGEISALKVHSSGHIYLTLKDEQSVMDAIIWRGVASRLAHKPEEGLEIRCLGHVTTYPARSKYQLIITTFEPAGVGALLKLFEERKEKLRLEGLFDAARKKHLPYLPKKIAVITSETGAVIQDILHRVEERFPCFILLCPVAVQGEGSVLSIQRALCQLEALPNQDKPDLVILARGGGSLEDLWGFNDEGLARQIAAFSIPIITAVGHETDTTLVDYVSDRRAPTPTAAAEIALPVRSDLIKNVSNLSLRLNNTVSALLDRAKILVHGLGQQLVHPRQAFEQLNIRLDDLVERQRTQVQHQLDRLTWHLSNLGRALRPPHLLLQDGRNQLAHLDHRLQKAWSQSVVGPRQERLKSFVHVLSSLAPQNTLKRGYAIVTRTSSAEIISSRVKAEQERDLSIQFHDGVVKTQVKGD